MSASPAYPVFEDINGQGGFRSVADITERNALLPSFRKEGMVVAVRSSGISYQLVGGILDANWKVYGGGSAFIGTYYVDPSFTGTATGSASNPFPTIAAAFAFAASLSITSGIVYIGGSVTENVTFPATGNWEIASQDTWGYFSCIINGTVDLTTSATARRALTNLQVVGAVTGAANGGGSRAHFTNCLFNSTLTLTSVGGALWRTIFEGRGAPGVVGLGGSSSGAVNVSGTIDATFWTYIQTVAFNQASTFFGSIFNAGITSNATAPTTLQFFANCDFASAQPITAAGAGSLRVSLDGASAANIMSHGVVLTGAITFTTQVANGSARSIINANAPAATLITSYPLTLMQVTATLTVLVPGTLGSAIAKVGYVDLTGTPQLKDVTAALDITSVAGTEVSGTVTFSQSYGQVTWQVDGIVTPGAASISVGIAACALN